MKIRVIITLFCVVVLAVFLRLPGMFWGYHICGKPFIPFHPDEEFLAVIAKKMFKSIPASFKKYPEGFPFQTALLASWLHCRHFYDFFLIGRALSIFYGVATVFLAFFLSLELFTSSNMALLSALFLSLAGLHVTQSHYATTDAGNTFWIYSSIYFSLLFSRRTKNIYFLAALLSCGFALAFKIAWIALVPVFAVLIKRRLNWVYWFAALFSASVFLVSANGGTDFLSHAKLIFENLLDDNLEVIKKHWDSLNLIVYFSELVPGLGLPLFLLFCGGMIVLIRRAGPMKNFLSGNLFLIFVLPLLLHFVSICFLQLPFPRQLLPLLPACSIVAAYGFSQIRKFKTLCLLGIVAYQLALVGATEYNFIYDTREQAWQWIRKNIPAGAELHLFPGVRLSRWRSHYKISTKEDAEFLLLPEVYYYRYFRSVLNPFVKYPSLSRIYHGTPENDRLIKDLFEGKKEDYRLVKKFEIKSLMPEMILFKKWLGSYQLFVGDMMIWQRKGNPSTAE